MLSHTKTTGKRNRRRGIVAVQVAVILSVLLGFAAFTIDLGLVHIVRADLQRTADAAALAGASAFTTDDMMLIRMGTGGQDTPLVVRTIAATLAAQFASLNPTYATDTSLVEPGDVVAGWINVESATELIDANPVPRDFNAVSVTVRREADGGEGSNGPIPYFIAPLFGFSSGETSATAVAAFDDRFVGFSVDVPGATVMPFSVHRDAWATDLAGGGDQYSYDENADQVDPTPDGIREVRLYPYPLSGTGYTEGDGNFGLLNIGTDNQGADAEVLQIIHGITAADLELEIGTSEPMFFDADSGPISYEITGSPGLTASSQDAIAPRIGEIVGFFLHDGVVNSGSTSVFTITGMRFGRVMDVRLKGAPSSRGLFVQPISYVGGGVRVGPWGPSSDGLVGRIVLVR